MLSAIIWYGDGRSEIIKGRTSSELFDQADQRGAVRLVDPLGVRFIKLTGEWYGLPSSQTSKRAHHQESS